MHDQSAGAPHGPSRIFKLFGILGNARVFASHSPALFSAALQHAGINGAYIPLRVEADQIAAALGGLRALNVAGVNVTVPFKETAIAHLDILSEGANIIGAINTIVCKGGQLKGFNTNAVGFMNALEAAGFAPAGRPALVFGSGGAARAVVFMLKWLQAGPIYVAGRDAAKTAALVQAIGGTPLTLADLAAAPLLAADLVVNATAVSSPEESPEMDRLVRGLQVADCDLMVDLNYGREQNFWHDWARRRRVRFMDGVPVLVHQARRSFALWTGVEVKPEVFLKALGLDVRALSPVAV
ncbi:MAG: shikimate dehydrogenase [Desulfobacterales bacterium]